MNELLFVGHIVLVLSFLLLALRMGKEALVAFIALMGVVANLFVLKQMVFFGFTITCSDVFIIGSILGLNLLQEYYGKKEAKKAVNISFIALLFFVVMSKVHLWYVPAAVDTTHASFLKLLDPAPRIMIASLAVFYFIQRLDVLLFGLLQKLILPVRMVISLVITQFLDTVLFSFAGLYGMVAAIFDIILISFLVKVTIILLSTPFVALSKRLKNEV